MTLVCLGVLGFGVGLCSGLKRAEIPVFRAFVKRPSTSSVNITPIMPHKTLRLAADGVESIPGRPCRHEALGCFVGSAVARATMRYL